MGLAHIDTELDRADSYQRPIQLVAILPCQLATLDLTWTGQTPNDQTSFVLVVKIYDHFTKKGRSVCFATLSF